MDELKSAILFIVVFGFILLLAYITTKFVGTRTSRIAKGKHIDIIETISLGFDSRLHLIKAGEEYVLISTSGKNTRLLTRVNMGDYSPKENEKEMSHFNFKDIFEKCFRGSKNRTEKDFYLKENEKKIDPRQGVFSNNLKKLQEIAAQISVHNTEHGEE
ncbi:MAG: flagellar biosynthetic protein FliO [Clostridium sp.]|nr:flagellar biosynthetic protein FliO [Clostridium sp.]